MTPTDDCPYSHQATLLSLLSLLSKVLSWLGEIQYKSLHTVTTATNLNLMNQNIDQERLIATIVIVKELSRGFWLRADLPLN